MGRPFGRPTQDYNLGYGFRGRSFPRGKQLDRIPITLLSGYLGSGKTTIINQLLSAPQEMEIAVLVNDFGAVNVDAELISRNGVVSLDLSNGCVCCTIGDDLGETLSAIAAWDKPPERLLLEASGIAEPSRVAMSAGNWPGFELDAIIVAADAETLRDRAMDKFVGKLIKSQLSSADLIVLTKTDLLSEERARSVTDWMEVLCPEANIVSASHGRLAQDLLFGPRLERQDTFLQCDTPTELPQFSTVSWQDELPVDLHAVSAALARLPRHIHRVKGFVIDKATNEGATVQRVGKRLELTASKAARNQLVFISTSTSCELKAALAEFKKNLASYDGMKST